MSAAWQAYIGICPCPQLGPAWPALPSLHAVEPHTYLPPCACDRQTNRLSCLHAHWLAGVKARRQVSRRLHRKLEQHAVIHDDACQHVTHALCACMHADGPLQIPELRLGHQQRAAPRQVGSRHHYLASGSVLGALRRPLDEGTWPTYPCTHSRMSYKLYLCASCPQPCVFLRLCMGWQSSRVQAHGTSSLPQPTRCRATGRCCKVARRAAGDD